MLRVISGRGYGFWLRLQLGYFFLNLLLSIRLSQTVHRGMELNCLIERCGNVTEISGCFKLGRVELELGRLEHADIFSHLLVDRLVLLRINSWGSEHAWVVYTGGHRLLCLIVTLLLLHKQIHCAKGHCWVR